MHHRLSLILAAGCVTLSGCAADGAPVATTTPTTTAFATTSTAETTAVTAESTAVTTTTSTVATTSTTATVPVIVPTPVTPPPRDDEFVRVRDHIPDIVVDLKYATTDNFTGQVIYDFDDTYLRFGTVKKLAAVQDALRQQGWGLKIWDGFRPVSAQFSLWEVCPDPAYVANPNNGFSSHSRGNTVDVTLVDADGNDVAMPTGFDDFSALADRDYSDCDDDTAAHARLLEDLMTEGGFSPYFAEWWHYTDTQSYPVETTFEPPTKEDTP